MSDFIVGTGKLQGEPGTPVYPKERTSTKNDGEIVKGQEAS